VQFTGAVMNLLPVPLVAMEGYSSKLIIFTGATPPQKMQILLRFLSNYMNKNVTFGCILPSRNVTSFVYLGIWRRDTYENSRLPFTLFH
jgi:hypothetical protein